MNLYRVVIREHNEDGPMRSCLISDIDRNTALDLANRLNTTFYECKVNQPLYAFAEQTPEF